LRPSKGMGRGPNVYLGIGGYKASEREIHLVK
jgi:hypothetical protein